VLTLGTKLLHTHAGGNWSVVVVVVAGAGCTAGVIVLALVLTAGAVVVVVEGAGCIVGVVFTRATTW
jgi:hypothetical protein